MELYRITSVPINIKANIFTLIDNPYSFVGRNFMNQDIIPFTYEDIQKCTKNK